MTKLSTWDHLEFNNTHGGLFLTYTNKNGARVAAALRRVFPQPGVLYAQSIELIEAGPMEGSIICQTPKTFSISCGEVPESGTNDQAGIAGVWYADNGDIILHAPRGAVRIVANDIELISTGVPSEDFDQGHVSIFANGDLRSVTNNIKMRAADVGGISAENQVVMTSTNKVLLQGETKVDEGHDVTTVLSSYGSGSKTPFQWIESIKKLTESIRSITN